MSAALIDTIIKMAKSRIRDKLTAAGFKPEAAGDFVDILDMKHKIAVCPIMGTVSAGGLDIEGPEIHSAIQSLRSAYPRALTVGGPNGIAYDPARGLTDPTYHAECMKTDPATVKASDDRVFEAAGKEGAANVHEIAKRIGEINFNKYSTESVFLAITDPIANEAWLKSNPKTHAEKMAEFYGGIGHSTDIQAAAREFDIRNGQTIPVPA